jgi:hypothetical protein
VDVLEPARLPRGLLELLEALPARLSLSERVALLNAPLDDLDGFTPLDWLADDGSAVIVTLVLLDPAELVAKVHEQLGGTLTAYLASAGPDEVTAWMRGLRRISDHTGLRLATALHASLVMRTRDSAPIVRAWFQGVNPVLDGVAPARVLREWRPGADTGFAVVIAARRHVGVSL